MVLFICSTPFHIYSVVSLASTIYREVEKDLYILDHSASNYEVYLKLSEEKIFNRVLFLKTKNLTGGRSDKRVVRYYNSAKHFLNSKHVTNQILNDMIYDSIFISSPDVPSQLIYYFYKNKSLTTQLFMYEDGTFAYNYFEYQYSGMKKRFLKLLFGRDIMKEHSGAYVYQPDYMKNHNGVKIYKMPKINKNNEDTKKILNKIMGYKPGHSEVFKAKFIYFDQAFQFDKTINAAKEILKHIVKVVGSDEVIVKLHPRTDIDSYSADCKVANINIPFEIITLNGNMENKVLISINSTACFNPKMVFDEEPFVILLYRLVDNSGIPHFSKEIDLLAEIVKKSYTNPSRFCIPESIKELEEILVRSRRS